MNTGPQTVPPEIVRCCKWERFCLRTMYFTMCMTDARRRDECSMKWVKKEKEPL